MKIRLKLILFFLLIAIVPMTLITTLIVSDTSHEILDKTLSQFKLLNNAKKENLEEILTHYSSGVKLLASLIQDDISFINNQTQDKAHKDNIESIFKNYILQNPAIYKIRFINTDGIEKIKVVTAKNNLSISSNNNLQNVSARPYFQQIISHTSSEFYISDLNLNEEDGHIETPYKPVLRFSTPLKNSSGQLLGVLIINVDMTDFLASLKETHLGDTMLIDQDGQLLIHPQSEKCFSKQLKTSFNYFSEQPELQENLSKFDSNYHYDNADHELRVWGKISFDHTDTNRYFVIIRRVPFVQLYKITHDLKTYALLLIVLFAGLSALLAWFIAQSIAKPIQNITDVAERIAQGDLKAKVEGVDANTKNRDEITILSKAINLMSDSLIKSNKKLSSIAESLRQNEEKFRNMFEGSPDAYLIMESADRGRISDCNKAAEIMLGGSREQIIGKTPDQVSPLHQPDGRLSSEAAAEKIKQVLENRSHNFVWVHQRLNGENFWAHVTISIIQIEGRTVFLVAWRDISKQYAQEEKLKEISSRLELATTSARIGVWDWNIVTNELIWDDMMLSLYGITRDEFTGAYEAWEKGVYFADKEAATLALQNAVAGKEKFDTTFRVIWPDKSIHYIRAMANVVFDENGKALKMVGVNWDITQQKDIDRMKNEFVSTVSHELRTPLTSIRGSLGLIVGKAAGELPAKMQPLVQIALSNCERLIRLINDILDVEKIESGKMEFKMKPANLIDVVKKSIAENENYAKQFDVNVNLTLQDENPIFANIDADKITQVITNLLSNAVKFSPKNGLVTVQVSTHDQRVRVAIIDQGGGIPEAFRSKIFSKFAQADSSDTKQKGGTGLGLSICKSLVHEHGGHIAFDSTLGKGSTFYFEIPVITSHAKSFIEKTHLESQRFLVCEDDPDIATLLRVILQDEGFTVDVAIDAAHAKKMILEHSYTGMTLDIMLPDKDGLSLLHELREIEKTKDLPVIIVSVKELSEHDKKKTMSDLNVHGWIPKPINVDNLLQNITQVSHTQKNNIKRVLHIEDDDDILDVVKQILIDVADVDFAKSCHEANNKLAKNKYDLILLDLLLPDGSGLSLLPPLNQTPGEYNIVIFSSHDVSVAPQANIAAVLLKSTTTNTKLKSTIQSLLENNTKKEV